MPQEQNDLNTVQRTSVYDYSQRNELPVSRIHGYIGKEMLFDQDRIDTLIAHRGPDDRGNLARGNESDPSQFAIQDLSPHGHQPMISADGRYVIIFNGEIYNHRTPDCIK
ncbi:MAG: hypothetical protein U0T81_13535 [Saprospiraceae bacterium]